jgi:hypothetical protein
VAVLFERRYQALGHVYICDGGRLGNVTLPEGFTDRGLPDDQGPLNVEVLAELAAAVKAIDRPLTRRDRHDSLVC